MLPATAGATRFRVASSALAAPPATPATPAQRHAYAARDESAGAELYSAHIAHRLVTTLRSTLVTFLEPAAPAPHRALTVMSRLVDTLAGYAIGSAVAPVLAVIRSVTGEPVARATIQRALFGAPRTGTAPLVPPPRLVHAAGTRSTRSLIDDPDQRPLVDELGIRLHHRLLADSAELCRAVASLLAGLTPEHRTAVEARLRDQAHDDLDALRFADQLDHGWRTYAAALGAGMLPRIDHDRSRELWREWLRRVRHERRIVEDRPALELGFIMRVA